MRVFSKEEQFNYFKADYKAITNFVSTRNWGGLLSTEDIEDNWAAQKAELILIRDKFVPHKKKSRNKRKWINKAVVKCRRAKVKAWNKYISSGRNSQLLYDKYKQILRKSVQTNNKAKIEFEKKLADNVKNDSKSFYAYVRSKQRSKVRVGPLKDTSDKIISDNKEAANLLNEYFASVFTVENVNNVPNPINFFKGE